MTGQLDEICRSVGRLEGAVGGIEKYIHEKRHDDANLAQKIEAFGTRITCDIAAVEGRIEGRIKVMDDRVLALELKAQREAGAKSFAIWFLQSPIVGWLAAVLLLLAGWWKGNPK